MKTRDPLSFLPCVRILDLPRRYTIYDPTRPPEHLYVVLSGYVRLFSTAENGEQMLVRVVPPEGLFGESSLVPLSTVRETATVMEHAEVMSWPAEEVRQQIERQPELGLALVATFGSQNMRLRDRLVAISLYTTGPRVMLALLQLAQSCGTPTSDGARRLAGLSHQTIADYVGTSRAIVTTELNRLRRLGYVTYSRRWLDVYSDALGEWLRQQGAPPAFSASRGVNSKELGTAASSYSIQGGS